MAIDLLDDEGSITPKFEGVLSAVFLRYASPTASTSTSLAPAPASSTTTAASSAPRAATPPPPAAAAGEEGGDGPIPEIFNNKVTLSRADLNRFSEDTNGQPMTDETFEEITNFFDGVESDADGHRLSFKGFLQLYQLQTENDPEETVNDLKSWGYGEDDLELVTTRKEAEGKVEEGVPVPLDELTGTGQGGERKDEKDR